MQPWVLALVGPVPVRRALPGGALIAVPATVLVSLGGLRYADPMQLLDHTPTLAVTGLLVYLATPFLSVALRDRSAWRDYALLFETAWSFTARYLLAGVLVAVFRALVFLSDAMMKLIDIDLIERMLDTGWLVFGSQWRGAGAGACRCARTAPDPVTVSGAPNVTPAGSLCAGNCRPVSGSLAVSRAVAAIWRWFLCGNVDVCVYSLDLSDLDCRGARR